MEAQWTLLIVATVVITLGMFGVGYWLEGQSSVKFRSDDSGNNGTSKAQEE